MAKMKFMTLTMQEGEDVMTYLEKFQAFMNKMIEVGIKVEDDDAINQILHGLPSSYKTFISTIGIQLGLILSILFGKLQWEKIMNEWFNQGDNDFVTFYLRNQSNGAFTVDVKSMLNENLGGILGGTQC